MEGNCVLRGLADLPMWDRWAAQRHDIPPPFLGAHAHVGCRKPKLGGRVRAGMTCDV